MEMNVAKLKQFLITLNKILKDLETENLALWAALRSATVAGNIEESPELLVETAKKTSTIRKVMDEKYDGPLAQALVQADKEENLAKAFFESLHTWKPTGPVN